jgi:beta-glucosidase
MSRRGALRGACLAVAVALAVPVGAHGQADPPWYGDPAVEQRARSLLAQMSLEEKIDLVTGEVNANYGFYNNPNQRLGIPAMQAADGPVGVRVSPKVRGGEATLLPSVPALASTFDEDRAFAYGRVLGVEAHLSDFNMMLAPTIDLLRDPFNPRAFETFSEDPLLTGKLGAADTAGVQSVPGVGATVKHYNLNTQEHRRSTVNVTVDERTLRELYTAPWERVVREAHPAAVMCAFTGVNGDRSCESDALQNDILKGDLGYRGFIMSDYGANLSTVESALGGLDMDQPGVPTGEPGYGSSNGTKWGRLLLEAVRAGQVPESVIDDKVLRILRSMIGLGMFETPPTIGDLPVAEHAAFARETSAEGTVLLKNERRMLPVTNRTLDSIAVIGPDADTLLFGGGSPKVNKPATSVSPLDGIRRRAGDDVDVTFHHGVEPVGPASLASALPPVPSSFLAPPGGQPGQGLRGEYFLTNDLSGDPAAVIENDPIAARATGFYTFFPGPVPRQPASPPAASIRWTGTITAPQTRTYRFGLTAFGTGRVYIDDQLVTEIVQGVEHTTKFFDLALRAGEAHEIRIEYVANSPRTTFLVGSQVVFGWQHGPDIVQPSIREAAQAAAAAEVAIVFARTYESEGFVDRPTLELPNDQGQLIREVARVNPRTIVVLQTGGPALTTGWDGRVRAILENWYGGEEQGRAIADVLWGDVNPSGSLPISFPRSDQQTPITFRGDPLQYPEINDQTEYREGVFIGYRGHEQFRIPPRWSFGHGISYTRFRYSRLRVPREPQNPSTGDISVSFRITNTGRRRGTEIAQVYTGRLPTSVETPPKQLAGWARATLDPGESQRVTVTLDPDALSYWDTNADERVTPTGRVRIMVGASAQNIRLGGAIRL